MELENGIDLDALLRGPTTFKVNLSSLMESVEQEALADDCVDEEPVVHQSPWLESFDSLRLEMTEVPNNVSKGKIFKRIIKDGVGEPMSGEYHRFKWSYNMFYEKESGSFDSSHFGECSTRSDNTEELFPGIFLAVTTMRPQEEAQFVIDYRLMFGERGIVAGDGNYQRRPRADILLCAKLVSIRWQMLTISLSVSEYSITFSPITFSAVIFLASFRRSDRQLAG